LVLCLYQTRPSNFTSPTVEEINCLLEKDLPVKIKIEDQKNMEPKSAKLLGVVMDYDQYEKSHFCGKGGLLSSLNQR
jgi:hypothetical protein